ncbi:unnamed protein product [Eruca vesicaria subsp. sativa]|uniref:Uncharacterized protein n=1 Tax=Eruca vesicaria subsp. sativa TaxID=29727 RepID=A0ABC8M2H6_ERUVS|nr:unnamed protein product [Eruca vesicaria subsp. sativa]
MANSYTLLSDLKAGRCSNSAEIRLLRFWEARNLNKKNQLMSIEMLMIDENQYKIQISDGPVAIRFNEGTDLQKLLTTSRIIPTEYFRFRPFEQIRDLANSGKQMPDVRGELRALKSTITDRLAGAPRVMLTLRMATGC